MPAIYQQNQQEQCNPCVCAVVAIAMHSIVVTLVIRAVLCALLLPLLAELLSCCGAEDSF
jgi:hypothetical protein